MKFNYSKENLSKRQKRLQRLFEVIPGLTSWTILLGMIFISIVFPFTGAIIIISFYLWWLLRLLYMTLFLILSYTKLNIEFKTNWMSRMYGIDNIHEHLKLLDTSHGLLTIRQRFSLLNGRASIIKTVSPNLH